MATFEEFLTKKRIDIALFAQNKPQEWQEYAHLYEKMGEKSFDHQKKFFFNSLRAMFPLTTPIVEVEKKKATSSSEGLPKKMPLKKAVVPTIENIEMPEKTPEEAVIVETPPPAPKKNTDEKTRGENSGGRKIKGRKGSFGSGKFTNVTATACGEKNAFEGETYYEGCGGGKIKGRKGSFGRGETTNATACGEKNAFEGETYYETCGGKEKRRGHLRKNRLKNKILITR